MWGPQTNASGVFKGLSPWRDLGGLPIAGLRVEPLADQILNERIDPKKIARKYHLSQPLEIVITFPTKINRIKLPSSL